MNKKINDEDVIIKVMDLCLKHSIDESNFYLKFLDTKIKRYENHLRFLEDTKPYFFQKEKLKEHNEKVEECERKIYESYVAMGKEVEMIIKTSDAIKSHKLNAPQKTDL